MSRSESTVSWAPRVNRERILQLYIKVASGNNDEELIEEIAQSFYNRCSDIIRIHERRFACPQCREELPLPHPPGKDLICDSCGWQMPWQSFFRTYQGKQLRVNADVTDITRKYLSELPECTTPNEKVILIDALIHACHGWVKRGVTYYGRPLAVSFIEGKMDQVVAFLENLPYGPDSLPEMTEQLMEWRKQCLSLFSITAVERDKVRYLVDFMPRELRTEIEWMLTQNQRQKAAARLKQIEEYSGEVQFMRGDVARQMVKIIEKRMKE